jgi:hypothetical protein
MMQAYYTREASHGMRKARRERVTSPVTRAALLVPEAAAAVDAIFTPWEIQLEAAMERLAALQATLNAQARRLSGLESELAEIQPVASVA